MKQNQVRFIASLLLGTFLFLPGCTNRGRSNTSSQRETSNQVSPLSNRETGKDILLVFFSHAHRLPSVLQVEYHPYWKKEDLRKRIAPYDIRMESWYPLGHGDKGLIVEPIFNALRKKYHKTNVQIILRWHIQEFPRTTDPKHMKDDFDIFDFSLTDEEMKEIEKMGHCTVPNSCTSS